MADPTTGTDGGVYGYLAAVAGTIAAAWQYFRSNRSTQAVNDASNEANISGITTLKELVATERAARERAEARADKFAEERNTAQAELYKSMGKIESLTDQIETLSKELSDLREQVSRLRVSSQQVTAS